MNEVTWSDIAGKLIKLNRSTQIFNLIDLHPLQTTRRYVDEVIRGDAPWSIAKEFITNHKIDFVVHVDTLCTSEDSDTYIKSKDMFLNIPRPEGKRSIEPDHLIKGLDKY